MKEGLEADAESCYRALRARDRRFDGVFFVGVATTGIYCRPICPARTPRPERCRFYANRGEAEAAGFRPCLRCRPEHAPGRADTESLSRLARAASEAIDAGFLDGQGLEELAARLTVSSRHLRRAFQAELGVSPLAWAQERRLAVARTLVLDTHLPLTRVAEVAGYRSLRRFNDAFVRQLGRAPSVARRLARHREEVGAEAATLSVRLDYRPPLPWTLMLELQRRKALGGVEVVDGDRYARTARVGDARGWWSLEPDGRRPALRLTVSLSLLPVLRTLVRQVRRQWDLDARPDVIEAHLRQFEPLRNGLGARAGLRVVGYADAFEGGVRILLGQQCSVAAAATLGTRFVQRAALRLEGGPAGLSLFFPSAGEVASWRVADVASLGLPRQRAGTICALAQAWALGDADADPRADPPTELPDVSGIGPWSRSLFALRVARDPDTFPAEDLVLRRALGLDAAAARRLATAWSPWRSYAAVHLWASSSRPMPATTDGGSP